MYIFLIPYLSLTSSCIITILLYMKNKRPGIKTKRNKKIVVQDQVPALFESLVAADGGATPFAIVKIESYDPATQQ